MIQVQGLTKRYGDKVAVEDLSFVVQPGRVTGFLGPNGAGKSTTMRLILGLDAPTRGSATVNGKPTASTPRPWVRSPGCWRPARSTPAAAPTTTCWPSPRPAASPAPGWMRWSSWWA
jgi:ABC-2 type transport system ATP-binding protein